MITAAFAVLCTGGVLLATQVSDRIESSAKKSYVFKTYLKSDHIKIHATSDSTVILTGTVSVWPHSSLAEETVAGLPGVVRVDNKLKVKNGHPAENSDAWISIKVKTMLLFHRSVSGFKTDVDVKNGVVVLHGHAKSEAQKELTTGYVRDVDGVQSVKNDMTVRNSKKTTLEKIGGNIDDASITAQVKVALLFHRSTSVMKTKVDTKNGVVTVRGVADNNAEKDLVSKLVIDIKGVKNLNNEMTIK
jgi:osmotically-inducible protein OsmY